MELENFCKLLPRGTSQPLGPEGTGFAYTNPLPSFVSPTLATQSGFGDVDAARVIVVSAPGAVGKSTLAREIASRCHLPLWDLAQSGPVGQSTLLGALSSAYGLTGIVQFLADLQTGAQCVVIDALDEARIKVNDQAFNAFLEDIAKFAQKSSRCSFILLGRTQITETAWLAIAALEVPVALVSIEPFSKPQAHEYIEKRIIHRGGPPADALKTHREPFEAARNILFALLEKAVSGDKSTEPFLGYAPVLDAMAIRLTESSNFEAARQELLSLAAETDKSTENETANRPAALLRQVCDDILKREHALKLLHNIKKLLEPSALKHGWNGWDSLYTPEEQCTRLAARLLDIPYNHHANLPPELRNKYEEQLSSFIGEHPFLRDGKFTANAVFESYLLARALFGASGAVRDAVEQRFVSGLTPATRLLADFYFLFMREEKGADLIPLTHVSPIYQSLASAESATTHVGLIVEGGDLDADAPWEPFADGEFVVCVHSGNEPRQNSYEFKTPIDKASSVLPISRKMSETFISVPCEIKLASIGGEFEIGPAVDLYCQKLSIDATSLVAVGKKPNNTPLGENADPAVLLQANECEAAYVSRVTVRGDLKVSWPGAQSYPWTDFYSGELTPRELQSDPRLAISFRRFKRIVLTLRSHSKGSLARYQKKVEHQRVLKGKVGQALLNSLVSDRVLRLDRSFYHWNPDAASEHVGVSWQQLKRGGASPQLIAYLTRFVTANSELFD